MNLQVKDIPILLNTATKITLGLSPEGPVLQIEDVSRGKAYHFLFTPDESQQIGVGLISTAAVFGFQQEHARAAVPDGLMPDVRGALASLKNRRH